MNVNSYCLLLVPLLIIGLQSGVECADSAAGNQASNDSAPSAKQQAYIAVNAQQPLAYQGYPSQPQPQSAPIYYYQPSYGPPRRRQSGSPGRSLLLYYALSMLTRTMTTTPSTECSYGSWSTCSSACLGTQTRVVTCSGVTTTQSQNCNTQLGFQASGWYRAANCYDYVVSPSATFTYDEAVVDCEATGGRLASAGIRDVDIRFDVSKAMLLANIDPVIVYIGVDRATGEWVWSDGVTAEPDVWTLTEPGTTTPDDHIRMAIGNPRSGQDIDGSQDFHYLCERAAQ